MKIKELKNKYPPGELLQRLGIPSEYLAIDRQRRVRCPFCEQDKKHSLAIYPDGYGHWKCFKCGLGGDAIDFAKEYLNLSIPEILRATRQHLGSNTANPRLSKPAQRIQPSPEELEQKERKCRALIAACERIHDSPVARAYFEARGLSESFNDPDLKDIYLHPALDYWEDGKANCTFPALVSLCRDSHGRDVSLHRTYLAHNSRTKAEVQSPRKYSASWVHPNPPRAIQLFEPTADVLIVAEGIETALAARQLSKNLPGGPYACFACGDANGLTKFIPPAGINQVIIAADNDPNQTGQDAGRKLADRLNREGISTALLIPNRSGEDWNDVLLECVRRG